MERKWWTLVAVAVGTFMLLLDVTIVNVALPDIEQALDASLADLQWVIDAYALTLAAFQLTAGSLADRFGRRKVFAIGIVVFTLGSLLCGVAGTPTFLSARARVPGRRRRDHVPHRPGAALERVPRARARHGVRRLRRDHRHRRGRRPGGRRRARPGSRWRWIFFVNLPVGIFALVITLRAGRRVARPPRAPRRLHRPRHLQRRPRRARVRPDPRQRGRLGRRQRRLLAGRRRRSCSSPS